MKKLLFITWLVVGLIALSPFNTSISEEIKPEECFYSSSLHFTAKGMGYWYDKKRGGLELLSNVSSSDLGCEKCHAPSCDSCHKVEKQGKAAYSTEAAKNPDMCLKCHGRQKAVMESDRNSNHEDVHLSQGMACMDCHTSREMHGDGIKYDSLKQPGAMDITCENCHDEVNSVPSHTVHKGKLDCKACHLRHVVSCTNCHMDTLIKTKKRAAIKVSGWIFLINYKGKVCSASMQNFVINRDKTFLMFAPRMSHSVMKKGRMCNDCHGAEVMKQVQKGKIVLTWLEDEKVNNLKGVIPVVAGVDYQCVYQNHKDGKWVPINNPAKPLVQYVGYGEPLSKKQLEQLIKIQDVP